MTLVADDLLGDVAEIRANDVLGAYRKKSRGPTEADDIGNVLSGVTQKWFMAVFKVDRRTVARALDGIRPVRVSNTGTAFYSVRDVAPRLVAPEMSIEDYITTLKPDDLPEQLRESYWNVQAKSQKVRLAAGELWRTSDVIEVFGEVFKHVKNTMMLWPDTVEEQCGELTNDQRHVIIACIDSLQNELHDTIVEQAKLSRTRSQLQEIDDVSV